MITRRIFTSAIAMSVGIAALAIGTPSQAADTIKIGEINSYTRLPQFAGPYKQGWQLGVEEVNAAGGVLGKKLEVISRDDAGKPSNAVRIAAELISRDKVDLLAGGLFSHIGLALADVAKQKKFFFLASEPLSDAITWAKGNRYTFRLRPNTYMQASMLAEVVAKFPAKRWATIAPNYAFGKDTVKAFKEILKQKRPDVTFVASQWPALFKMDAGAEVQALSRAKPDAIFNVTFGSDLIKFVREGRLRGLFKGRKVASILTGEPEYLETFKDETPNDWVVTGYPWDQIRTPIHTKFVTAFQKRFNANPKLGSLVGYNMILAIAAGVKKAGSTDTEALIKAFRGLEVTDGPLGPFKFRAIDHQSTMGAHIGRTKMVNGKGVMTDWYYAPGEKHFPPDAEVRKRRPAEAMM